ncbi:MULTISPECIES: selenocysteine-specific translation elongation factor [unclassified Lentimicrobium]|uniref:selenocysteine-specific translation elongation factor n=1 Tax=unclassified Lentimicrobium TaxID=2677434 RepID=UPI001557FF76|nr:MULTISPECIES: selenocysteine-specific translation elongation factor [unclassified Lentimicrobium]NPD46412.1 selenocysteine-specific translation elongation factor [Lentimicrobium sp. S6]NPD83598.1 selenocysteine-specific translation elongation factor [Lentimicrobium sp. L6]
MKHLIMGTAGHVDHGKTSLIKALTNIDCDTHKEEKERGITINLGFSHIDLPSGHSVGIIDVPGHKDFINTMVGGACGIDFVLLVIAADSGVMPQTKEHFNIIRALKVKKAIIALNKIDLVDEEIAELAKLEIMEWLEGTEFEEAPIVGVSSISGQGLDELKQEIENIIPQIETQKQDQFFRMFIDRIFTVKGMGSVVTGSVLNGEIEVEEEVFLLPGNKDKLRLRGIQRHGKKVEKVVAGDRAAFNLTGLKPDDFERGMLLSNQELENTLMIDAYITLFENSVDLGIWSTVVFHSGTFDTQARMHLLDKDKLKPGESGLVQLVLEKESVLIHKDKFILRNSSGDKSIGGGIIIDAKPLHHRKRTKKLLQSLELLVDGILNEGKTAELILIELKKENLPLNLHLLKDKLKMTEEDLLQEDKNLKGISLYPNHIYMAEIAEWEIIKKVKALILEFHEKNPMLTKGLNELELLGKLGLNKNKVFKEYLPHLLLKMEEDKHIKSIAMTWALSSHEVKLSKKEKADIEWLEQTIKDYGPQKPIYVDINQAAYQRMISKDKLASYIDFLIQNGKLSYYKNEYAHASLVMKYRKELLQVLANHKEGLFLQPLKQETGLSKKMLPFLIEMFEAEKILITSEHKKENYRTQITEFGLRILSM